MSSKRFPERDHGPAVVCQGDCVSGGSCHLDRECVLGLARRKRVGAVLAKPLDLELLKNTIGELLGSTVAGRGDIYLLIIK